MDSERWKRVSDLFADCLELPASDREALLRAKGESDDVIGEVKRLLAAHESAGSFLASPAAGSVDEEAAPARAFEDGDILGARFRVVRLLGSGGMGEVYEAFDMQLQDRVAVKTLHQTSAVNQKMVDRFRIEVLRSRQITHSHVGRVYDLFTHRGAGGGEVLFFTMELLQGETLAQWIARRGPFTAEAALPLIRQICDALEAAHSAGIIHRDLKPSNIFLSTSASGEIRATITDFGIAAEAGAPEAASVPGRFETTTVSVLAGTPAYMSPEQLRGEAATAQSDVYSLALVVFEMLVGKRLFEANSPFACSLKKLDQTEVTVPEIPGLPADWGEALRRALRVEPGERFGRPADFLATLERHATPRGISRRAVLCAGIAAPLVAGGAVAYEKGWLLPWGLGEIASLAILPFENAGGDRQMQYFSDGIGEELTHDLTAYKKLYVAAESSAFRFRNRSEPETEVARKLGVRMLLTGSVRRSNERVHLSVQLIDGRSGRQVWSQIYDRDLGQIFEIQAEIVKEVAARLAVNDVQANPRAATTNSKAYDLYLKGRYEWNKRTRDGMLKGLEYFGQAADLDAKFALAWSGIADCYLILGDYGWMHPDEAAPKIREALDRSLAIDPDSAETLASLGLFNNVFAWDQAAAERAFQRSLVLKPSLFVTHSWYGNYLMLGSRWDEALREAETGRKLDPVSLPTLVFLGWVRYYRREYGRAIEIGKQVVAQDRSFPHGHQLLAMSYGGQRDAAAALKESDEAFRLTSDPAVGFRYRAVALSQVPELEAQARAAAARVEDLSQDRQAGYLAIAYAGLGDAAKTWEWIDRGAERHDAALHMTIISPQLDRYREEPRFQQLVARLGYPRQNPARASR